jgi:hypothetical protein
VAEIQERKTSKTKVGALAQEIKRSGEYYYHGLYLWRIHTEEEETRESLD